MVSISDIVAILDKVDHVYLVQDSSGIYYVTSPAQVERRRRIDPKAKSIKITKADIGERSLEQLFEPDAPAKSEAAKPVKKPAKRTNVKKQNIKQ